MALVDGQTKALTLAARVAVSPEELPRVVAEMLNAQIVTDPQLIQDRAGRRVGDGATLQVPSPWSGLYVFSAVLALLVAATGSVPADAQTATSQTSASAVASASSSLVAAAAVPRPDQGPHHSLPVVTWDEDDSRLARGGGGINSRFHNATRRPRQPQGRHRSVRVRVSTSREDEVWVKFAWRQPVWLRRGATEATLEA